LISFLFAVLLLTVPPCPAICNSGGTCPRAPPVPYGVGPTAKMCSLLIMKLASVTEHKKEYVSLSDFD